MCRVVLFCMRRLRRGWREWHWNSLPRAATFLLSTRLISLTPICLFHYFMWTNICPFIYRTERRPCSWPCTWPGRKRVHPAKSSGLCPLAAYHLTIGPIIYHNSASSLSRVGVTQCRLLRLKFPTSLTKSFFNYFPSFYFYFYFYSFNFFKLLFLKRKGRWYST